MGEITGRRIRLGEYGNNSFEVIGTCCLQRLGHAVRNRVFERKSRSAVIADLLGKYGLQAETDQFGPEKARLEGGPRTDLDLALALAGEYGRDVYCRGETVYVKALMPFQQEEVIYEWGKSLTSGSPPPPQKQ